MRALLWLRRDLRLHDHPALNAALEAADEVIPVFCFDPGLLRGRHASGPRTQFMLESLEDLRVSLRARGGELVLRGGRPEQVVPALARELGASIVFTSAEVSPFGHSREQSVRRGCRHAGSELRTQRGLFAVDDPAVIRSSADRPYTVFTPFFRAWLGQPRRPVVPAPPSLPELPSGLDGGPLPTLEELGLDERVNDPAPGGEQAGRRAMQRFLARGLRGYGRERDELGRNASSRLSPYLHFGCVSPRELEQRLDRYLGGDAFRRQLCWRDFYAHVLANFPANASTEFRGRYRGAIRWSHARREYEAWCAGATGYPLVDAGMRQLRREGWMHNRARLVVGSFLTKDLGIDWRWGERWFMRWLIDGDEANNNGNWQWIASVGVDPQPPFRRIYNPARQQQRFDPHGDYVRHNVPELKDVPDEYLAEPWKMPSDVQRLARCVIGEDYPRPIVDHAAARRAALERFAETDPSALPAGG